MIETTAPEQHAEPASNQPVPAVGAQLAAEREARSWSIEQVAHQLNLAPRQIQALECDDYAALPGMASVRGFIRAYAKLLKLDAAPMIATISPELAPPSESVVVRRALPSVPFIENRWLSSRRRGLPAKLFAGLLGLGVVLAIVLVGEQMGWIPGSQQPLAAALKAWDALRPADPVVSPIADVPQHNDADAIADSATVTASKPVAPAAAPVAVASVPPAPLAILNEKPNDKPTATSAGLVLKLREDSWVEIRRANNSVLISRLVKAGSTESFELTGPLSLTLGNAAGVDASLRGAPLDLMTGTQSNVARLKLK
jgi:cytoskeleton protein RodZ